MTASRAPHDRTATAAAERPPVEEPEAPEELRVAGSLTRKTGARVVSDLLQLLLATLIGVVTARLLGPSGKGTLATLSFLGLLAATLAGAGLGEATVVRVGQGRIGLNDAIAATLAGVAATSAFAAVCMFIAGLVVFSGEWSEARVPLLIATAAVPLIAYFDALQQLLNVREQIVATAKLALLATAVTAVATVVFLGPLHWGLEGAVAASVLGPLVATLGCAWLLRRTGSRLAMRWDSGYIRWGLSYGTKVQSAYLAGTLAARFDLVLVFAIAGSTQAGYYSVALTIGAVVGLVPWSVSASTFPRIASVSPEEARQLIITICRLGLIAGLCVAVALAVITPIAVPILYGQRFSPAVVPALILIFGGLLSALQGLLCRGISARGDPRLLVVAAMTSFLVMVAADVVVIGPFGIIAAAIVASVSPVIGTLVALRLRSRAAADVPYLRELIPRPADFRFALAIVLRILRQAKSWCLARIGLAASS